MGVEPRTAREMIDFGRRVEAVGLDAMQVYSLDMGHLGIPRPEELERYFTEVLDAVRIDCVLSTHFSVGYLVPVDLLVSLCERYPHVVGVNCSISGGDLPYLVRLLAALPPRVEVHVGGPMHALSALRDGRHRLPVVGGQPGAAARAVRGGGVRGGRRRGRRRRVRDGHARVLPAVVAVAVKAMLRALGLPGGWPRLPRMFVGDELDPVATVAALRELAIPELAGVLGR